jgi:hypothetical protein
MLGNYRVAEQVVASRVVLSSTELVSYEHWRKSANYNVPKYTTFSNVYIITQLYSAPCLKHFLPYTQTSRECTPPPHFTVPNCVTCTSVPMIKLFQATCSKELLRVLHFGDRCRNKSWEETLNIATRPPCGVGCQYSGAICCPLTDSSLGCAGYPLGVVGASHPPARCSWHSLFQQLKSRVTRTAQRRGQFPKLGDVSVAN